MKPSLRGSLKPKQIKTLRQNNYYPFGLKHKDYNEIAGTGYKYKFGGKELNSELGLELYDFGARNYDAAIGRWLNVDPLAENSRRWTPYNYAYNNPIFFVDPDGMQASPIFGLDGSYLGNDNQGFEGEVIFMDQSTFFRQGGTTSLDVNAKGTISHQDAKTFGRTVNQVVTNQPDMNFTQNEIDMINNAASFIVRQMNDLGPSVDKLHNGSTSMHYAASKTNPQTGLDVFRLVSNNGDKTSLLGDTEAPASMTYNPNKFTFNLMSSIWLKNEQFTVENIQNTAVHELKGHLNNKIPGGTTSDHAKAYDLQMSHPSWKNTTKSFKESIIEGRKKVLNQ